MRAITLRQPWASQVFDRHNPKDIENRTTLKPPSDVFALTPRGRLPFVAIHAGQKYEKNPAYPRNVVIPAREGLAFGAIIGVVRVQLAVDWRGEAPVELRKAPLYGSPRQIKASPWWLGPIGWKLVDAIPIKPVPCKGLLGAWHVPSSVVLEVANNLDEALRDELWARSSGLADSNFMRHQPSGDVADALSDALALQADAIRSMELQKIQARAREMAVGK